MKRSLPLWICLIAAANLAQTNVPPSGPQPVRVEMKDSFLLDRAVSPFMGTNYVTELRWAALKASVWNGETAPPLPAARAEALAEKFLQQELPTEAPITPSMPRWVSTSVSLRRYGHFQNWYYEIKMVPHIRGSFNTPVVTVFLTLDGKPCALRPLGPAPEQKPTEAR